MIQVMYIDDDADDRELLELALRKKRPDVTILLASGGGEGFIHLKQMSGNGMPLPAILIMDLNMPGWNGQETFTRIRSEPALRRIPVAVLSSGISPQDKAFFGLSGNVSFYSKPNSLAELDNILEKILQTV